MSEKQNKKPRSPKKGTTVDTEVEQIPQSEIKKTSEEIVDLLSSHNKPDFKNLKHQTTDDENKIAEAFESLVGKLDDMTVGFEIKPISKYNNFRDFLLKRNQGGIPVSFLNREEGTKQFYGFKEYDNKNNRLLLSNVSYMEIRDPKAQFISGRYDFISRTKNQVIAEFHDEGSESIFHCLDSEGDVKYPLYSKVIDKRLKEIDL